MNYLRTYESFSRRHHRIAWARLRNKPVTVRLVPYENAKEIDDLYYSGGDD